jgi:putative ABC transport system permease protein
LFSGDEIAGGVSSLPGRLGVDLGAASLVTGRTPSQLRGGMDQGSDVVVRLAPGTSVEEFLARLPAPAPSDGPVVLASQTRERVSALVQPYVVTLWLFVAFTVVGAIAIVGRVIARQAAIDASAHNLFRALGADRRMLAMFVVARAAVIGIVATIVATGLAAGSSALFPFGPVAAAEPHPGVALNAAVLGIGALLVLLFVGLASAVAVRSWNLTRRGLTQRPRRMRPLIHAFGLSPGLGMRFAFPHRRLERSLMRSTIVTVALSIAAATAVIVFVGSLDRLVARPERLGRSWDLAVTCHEGYCDRITPAAGLALEADKRVTGWTMAGFNTITELDGQQVPTVFSILGKGHVAASTIVEGREAQDVDEVVLGGDTMHKLGAHIGGTVVAGHDHVMTVVGRAVFAGVGPTDRTRASLGTGAAMTQQGATVASGSEQHPQTLLLTAADSYGVDDIQRVHRFVTVVDTQLAGGLYDWTSLRQLPLLLVALFCLLAVAAAAHAFSWAMRFQQADFAVLSAMGLDRRRLRIVVGWQVGTLLAAATLAGVALGLFVGNSAWHAEKTNLTVQSPTSVHVVALLLLVVALSVAMAAMAALAIRPALTRTSSEQLSAE